MRRIEASRLLREERMRRIEASRLLREERGITRRRESSLLR